MQNYAGVHLEERRSFTSCTPAKMPRDSWDDSWLTKFPARHQEKILYDVVAIGFLVCLVSSVISNLTKRRICKFAERFFPIFLCRNDYLRVWN